MSNPMDSRFVSVPLLVGLSAVIGLVLAGPESAFAQCAMCRDAVAASSSQTRTAMNYAIVGLALTPYGVAVMAAWALSPTVRVWTSRTLRRLTFKRTGNDQ
jgi:hypothetical protein